MYFPVKVAVARLGGPIAAAQALGVRATAVNSWISPSLRSQPGPDVLDNLARLSGVSLASLKLYYRQLGFYRVRERFRRV